MTAPTSNESHDWFFKYLPVSPDDRKWGLFVTAAGTSHIAPHGRYPPTRHPTGYHLIWPHPRVLRELQCILISNGQGVFETRMTKRRTIKAGDLFMLFPGVWHKYTPDTETGGTNIGCRSTATSLATCSSAELFHPGRRCSRPDKTTWCRIVTTG